MNSGIEPRITVTFRQANAIPNAIGTFVNKATISTIAKAIQMMNKTIVEFFIVFPFTEKGWFCMPPPD